MRIIRQYHILDKIIVFLSLHKNPTAFDHITFPMVAWK